MIPARQTSPRHVLRQCVLASLASIAIVCGAALALALAARAGGDGPLGSLAGTGYPHGRCFPADQWGPAPDRVRPCAEVRRVYEDGSVRIRVRDHSGTVRYGYGVGALDR